MFWADHPYDQRNADPDTGSRYGNYLQAHRQLFDELNYADPTTEFVVAAWRIARPPIMSPPFVRSHPRILSASVERSDWNGELIAHIEIAAPRPAGLDAGSRFYADWPADPTEGIDGRDLAARAYLLTHVQVLEQLPRLPPISEIPRSLTALTVLAVGCLDRLVDVLNQRIAPLVKQLDRS
jgi:hypothetical protein